MLYKLSIIDINTSFVNYALQVVSNWTNKSLYSIVHVFYIVRHMQWPNVP